MSETRAFHLGDILSITTERLVSPRHIEGVYDILGWMAGESLMTHQLVRVARECQKPLLAQHPDLRDIAVPRDLDSEGKVTAWLAGQVILYGETREVTPLAAEDHTHIDPITELRTMRADDEITVVVVPETEQQS